jgi:hypothetical protein
MGWPRSAIQSAREFQWWSTLVATTTFAFWREYCDWVKATFSFLVISKSYALQKDHTFQLLRFDA